MHFSTATRVAAVAGSATLVAALAITAPAFASGLNHGRVWESGLFGINVNAEVYVQPSYSEADRHAAGGKMHLWRTAGPAVNVYGYTEAARSRDDTRILHVKKTVRDSVLPGDKYVTRGSYATIWFTGGGGCSVADDWAPAVDTSSQDATAVDDTASDAPPLIIPC